MANRINYQVGFDIQKSGLNQLKASLQQLSKMSFNDLMKINHSDRDAAIGDLKAIKAQVVNVENALKKAFNAKLDSINVETFNQQINKTSGSIENVYNTFKKAGAAGESTFRNLSSQVLNTNVQLKEAHTLLDNMATTLANTIKWNVASSAINSLSGSVQQAFGYVKSLDTSLNDIRIVTNKTAEDMDVFAEKANKVAQSLGKTTTDYTEAALIYAQQGLSDKEIQERAKITLETANVTGQSTDEVSEQLTAVWNGYKVSADEAQVYVDRLAAVAATTASDLEELSTGMSKVASAANLMGVGEDQLAAMLSTVISVTREAPETVGSALKTIFARINDISAGVAEDGATLGRFSGKMAEYGFNVLDANGHLRDMGDVLEEIGGKWETLSREQQVALSQIMGGKYQYSRLLSLFDNFDQYNKALETAREAEGTLQEQQDIYMESTAAHLNTLKASFENIFDSFLNTDSINGFVDTLSSAANIAATFIDSLGGGGAILRDLGAIGVTVFSNQIAKGINTTITNFEIAKNNTKQFDQALQATREWQGIPGLDEVSKDLLNNREQMLELTKYMKPQQFSGLQTLLNDMTQVGNQLSKFSEKRSFLDAAIKEVTNYKDGWEDLNDVLKDQQAQEDIVKRLKQQENEFKDLQTEIQKYGKTLSGLGDSALRGNDISENLENARVQVNNYITALNDLAEKGQLKQHQEQVKNLQKQLSELDDSIPDAQIAIKLDRINKDLKNIAANAGDSIEETRKDLETEFSQTAKSIGSQVDSLTQKFKGMKENFASGLESITRTIDIEKIAKFAGGISQVGSAISQVQSVGSIFANNDLSDAEKFTQSMSNLVPTVGMAAYGIKSLGEALGFALGPFGLIAGLITAAGAALSIYNGYLKQNQQQRIENNKAAIQEQNQRQQEIASHKQLYNSLQELDNQYKNGQISRSDLKGEVEDLIKQYGLEGEAADNLRNSYQDLSAAIDEAREKEAEELVTSTKREKRKAGRNLKEAMNDDSLLGNKDVQGGRYSFSSDAQESDRIKKQLQKVGGNLVSDSNSLVEFISFQVDPHSEKSIVEFYEKVQKAVDKIEELNAKGKISDQELEQSSYYKQMTGILGQLSEEYNTYKDAVKDAKAAQEEQDTLKAVKSTSVDLENVKNVNEYLEQRLSLIDELRSKGYDDNRASEAVDSYLKENFSELYNQYNDTASYIDQLKEKLGDTSLKVEDLINGLNDQQLAALMSVQPDSLNSWEQWNAILTNIAEKDFSNISDLKNIDIDAMQQSASERYSMLQSLEDQVANGKGVSKSSFENLQNVLSEEDITKLKDYFDMMANGTYKMTGDAEGFYQTINRFKLEGFWDTLDAIQAKMQQINSISQQMSENDFNYEQLDQSAFGAGAVGFDFNTDLFKEQLDYLEAVQGATEGQIENWRYLAENQQLSVETCEEVAAAIHQAGDYTQDLDGQTQALVQSTREVERAIYEAMFPLDSDIDESALNALAETIQQLAPVVEELSEDLANTQYAAQDAAQAILRFDNAIVDVVDHYDEWKAALENGSWQDQAQAINGLRDAYADMLDIDGSVLSEEFLTNTYNLQLMKAAIDGNIDAYNELVSIAGQDIAVQVGVNVEDFRSQVDELLNEYYNIQSLDDLQVGARLDDDDFLAALTNLVNQAKMTATQAQGFLLDNLGIDAEVIQDRTQTTEYQQVPSTQVEAVDVPGDYSLPEYTGDGKVNVVTGQSHMTSYRGIPKKQPIEAQKQGVAFGLKVTAAGKSVGGDIKYTQSKHGGGSAGVARRDAQAQAESQAAAKAQQEADAAARKAQQQADRVARQQEQARQKAERQAEQQRRKEEQAAKKAQQQQEKAARQAQQNAQKAARAAQQNIDTSQKDEKDLLEDNRDLYHDINIQIKEIDRGLERVQKRQDRLYGKNLLDNLNKQTEILEKHKKKLKEKQQIQQYDIDLQRKSLENLGAAFDQYGNISNYMDLIAKKQNLVNSLIQQYNVIVNNFNASTDKEYKKTLSEQMDRINKQITEAQKELKDTQTKVKNYDSVRDAMEDITDQIEEQTQKQIEINISKFRMQLEIRLDMGEAQRDWNEFERKVINHTDVIKDSDLSALFRDAQTDVSDINSYFNVYGEKGSIQMLTEQLLNTHDQILAIQNTGWSPIYGDNEKQALEDFKGDLNQLMDQMIKLNDYVDSIDQAYLKTIDLTQAKFDQHMKDYQFVDGLIQHDMDLLKLLYGDKNYAAMDKYYQKKKENSLQSIDFLTREVNYWKQMWDNAEGEQDAKKFKENYEKALQEQRKAIEDHGKLLQNTLSNAIKGAFKELEDKLTDSKGFEYLDLEWDLMNMNEEGYLDDINASFAIQDLENQFKKALKSRAALNDADVKNIKAQQQIKKLMDEQLANLKEKEKVTQYDVDRVQKLLEIEQARIALEDARANKTTMQLRRDSQGNYSYEYVADQDGIQEAQDNLAKAQNDLYNFDKDKYKSNLEDILAAWKDYQEKYEEIRTDMNLNDQQRMERLALLDQEYGEYMNNLHKQNADIRNNLEDSAFGELASLYDTDVANYKEMSQKEKEILLGDLVPEWDSGIQKMADKFAGEGGFIPTCEDAFIKISEATKDYEQELDQMATTAEFDLSSLKDGIDDAIDSYSELIDNNEELIEVWKKAIDTISEMKTQAHYLVSEFNAVYLSAMQAVKGMSAFYDAQQAKAAAEAAQYSGGAVDPTPTYNDNSSNDNSAYIDFSGGGGDGDPNVGDVVTFEGQYYHDSWGQAPAGSKYAGVEGGVIIDDYSSVDYGGRATKTGDYDVHIKSADGRYPDLGWVRLSQLRGYATGGYTGDWAGPEGRIGILHQKEMVLNANDTKNILDSVGILRDLMDNAGINMFARLSGLRSDSYNPLSNNESFEQNVHIDATFPNVDSKREIEQAFNDLVNLAAQRAMRR